MKIGCLVYVPLPSMLRFHERPKMPRNGPFPEEMLVLFMN
jgi:hypothetical protein